MTFAAYSTDPDSNTSLNGISIAEGCPSANINNALRQVAADGKELYNIVSAVSVSSYMPLAGGAFTGNITRSGAGGFLYFASSSLASAPVYVQLAATALPAAPAEGTIVLQY